MRRLLFLICILGVFSSARAQSTAANWANLSTLRAGETIQVREAKKAKVEGRFLNFTDAAIMVQAEAGPQTIPKENVRSVRAERNKARGRNALLGAAVGAGAGAAITAAAWPSNGLYDGKAFGAGIGAIFGGIVGTVVGVLLPPHETIYRVKMH